jgi:hypothetical protein
MLAKMVVDKDCGIMERKFEKLRFFVEEGSVRTRTGGVGFGKSFR